LKTKKCKYDKRFFFLHSAYNWLVICHYHCLAELKKKKGYTCRKLYSTES